MSRFYELERCAELTPAHAREAAASLASMHSFLEWATRQARPEEGAPKVLLAIAALVEERWVGGTLYVDINGDDWTTRISVFVDYGFGIRERLLPVAQLDAPFDEFVRAARLSPKLIAPLEAEHLGGSLVLTPPGAEAANDADATAIAESSLHAGVLKTSPPPDEEPAAAAMTKPPPSIPEQSGIHTHPTVRRMVAVRPEALRSGNDD